MNNRYFVFLVPNRNPYYIRFYGSHKMIIEHDERKIQIIHSHGWEITKSVIFSEISHYFDLPYIKHYNKKCIIMEIEPNEFN